MRNRKHIILAALFGVFGIGAAMLAFAMPGAAACALVNVANLQSLPDGTLVDPGTTGRDRARLHELVTRARGRIEAMYGAPRANPTIVFFQNPGTFWWLAVNSYGSTNFVGSRACVIVGPEGHNPDVVAHELMHAELADRVGHWRRFIAVPVWFDEGVAMQLDLRARYALPSGSQVNTSYVRQFQSAHSFSQASEEGLTRNYASAKAEVAQWLVNVDPKSLYSRLERVANGEI